MIQLIVTILENYVILYESDRVGRQTIAKSFGYS